MNTVSPAPGRRCFPVLRALACTTAALYILLVVLMPLPNLHFSDTPLAVEWDWILLPSHLLLLGLRFLSLDPQQIPWLAPLLVGFTLSALVAVYALALVYVQRSTLSGYPQGNAPTMITSHRRHPRIIVEALPCGHPDFQHWLFFLLGSTLLFGLILLMEPKLFSDDVFTYIFSGRILAIYHADPLNNVPIQFPFDAYLRWVISGRNAPNIYGPLWLCIAALLVSFRSHPVGTLFLFKGLALLSHLLNCVLVWAILGKVAPLRRVLGTLIYAWNPLIVIELVGSGHSEGVLMCLLLIATWLHVQTSGKRRTIGPLLVLGLAISTNLIVLLLAPLYIWFELRSIHTASQLLKGFCWRTCVVLLPALAISLPFWRGTPTFFALTSAIDMEHFVHSPIGTFAIPLRIAFSTIAVWLHLSPTLQPITSADITIRASATCIFALIYLDVFGTIRRTPKDVHALSSRDGGRADEGWGPLWSSVPEGNLLVRDVSEHSGRPQGSPPPIHPTPVPTAEDVLLTGWVTAVFWYTVLVSGWFWPWYLLWILWAIALRRLDVLSTTLLMLSGLALLFYPLLAISGTMNSTYQPTLIFGIPLFYLIIVKWRERQKERTSITYDRRSETAKN